MLSEWLAEKQSVALNVEKRILLETHSAETAAKNPFNLRFYVASFADYGLHTDCMCTLAEFRELCKA